MALTVPKQEITHYGTATTDAVLCNADIDSVHLTVAEISWTPPEKQSGVEVTPGNLPYGLLTRLER
jgi:hypothetical protein